MATRNIKDAKDLSTNELIYFKGHAQATYMSDGRTVEEVVCGMSEGTVTGVMINGTTKNPSNGVVDLGNVITAHQDLSDYQPKLVSGTNIKTINGESILGNGNIIISGGGNISSSGAYAEVNHGTSDTIFTLTPNTFHVWGEVASLTLTLGVETAGVANEFLFQFHSGFTPTTLTLPDTIKWMNDSAPTIESNKIYQISILKGLGSVLEFTVPLITFTIDDTEYQAEEGMTWGEWVESSYNTLGYYAGSSVIGLWGGTVKLNGVLVHPSDLIIAGTNYNLSGGGTSD